MLADLIPGLVPNLVPDLVADPVPDPVPDVGPDLVPDLVHDLVADMVPDLVPYEGSRPTYWAVWGADAPPGDKKNKQIRLRLISEMYLVILQKLTVK